MGKQNMLHQHDDILFGNKKEMEVQQKLQHGDP